MQASLVTKKIRFATKPQSQPSLAWDNVHTVCEESRCPNRQECFSAGVATFLVGGDLCTRSCGFCSVGTGRGVNMESLMEREENEILEHILKYKLKFIVITSVTRDDQERALAEHFRNLINSIHSKGVGVEVLIPDFHANIELLGTVLSAGPEVLSHNLETVERLTPHVRSVASYRTSLEVFQKARSISEKTVLKSGLMVGLGETLEEIEQTLRDMKDNGVETVTIGQYMRPSEEQLPVERIYTAEDFQFLENMIRSIGFTGWKTGPYVRSSYMAEEVFQLQQEKAYGSRKSKI